MNMINFDENNSSKVKSGFTTPDNYFETFSNTILQKIKEDEKPVISLFSNKIRLVLAVAATLLIGLFVSQFQFTSQNIPSEDIENYIAYSSSMNQYELVSMLEQDDIDNMTLDYNLESDDIGEFLHHNSNIEILINE